MSNRIQCYSKHIGGEEIKTYDKLLIKSKTSYVKDKSIILEMDDLDHTIDEFSNYDNIFDDKFINNYVENNDYYNNLFRRIKHLIKNYNLLEGEIGSKYNKNKNQIIDEDEDEDELEDKDKTKNDAKIQNLKKILESRKFNYFSKEVISIYSHLKKLYNNFNIFCTDIFISEEKIEEFESKIDEFDDLYNSIEKKLYKNIKNLFYNKEKDVKITFSNLFFQNIDKELMIFINRILLILKNILQIFN